MTCDHTLTSKRASRSFRIMLCPQLPGFLTDSQGIHQGIDIVTFMGRGEGDPEPALTFWHGRRAHGWSVEPQSQE